MKDVLQPVIGRRGEFEPHYRLVPALPDLFPDPFPQVQLRMIFEAYFCVAREAKQGRRLERHAGIQLEIGRAHV